MRRKDNYVKESDEKIEKKSGISGEQRKGH